MSKLALCIGINDYPGTDSDLTGCVNDANDWAEALRERGFAVNRLLDAEATGDAMRAGMRDLLDRARSGDVVAITYSGHGTWVPDQDGDEPDRRDEALCPHDVRTAGPLLDDELYTIFSDRARGTRVVLISDSCHSGTVAKFAPATTGSRRRVRFLPPAHFLTKEEIEAARRIPRAFPGRARQSALLLSGCQDIEYSYDAVFGDRPNGAFTYVALDALRALPPDATYRQWLTAISARLPSVDYPQTPGLSGSSTQKRWPVLA